MLGKLPITGVALLLGWLPACAWCAAPRPFSIERSEVVDIHAAANNKDYQLYIKLPSDYQQHPEKKYPLVVLTDGFYAFPLLSSINWRMSERHAEYQEPIVLGISYSRGDSIDASRNRDYTPATGAADSKPGYGKAQEYIQFLAQQVLPYASKHYRVDESKQIFAGHSYGGLLGTYLLLTQPELFDYYLIGSPSLDYGQNRLFALEADYAKTHKALPAKVLMITGGREGQGVRDMRAFAKLLQSRHYQGLEISAKVLEQESHLSGFPSFITEGLLWALPLATTPSSH